MIETIENFITNEEQQTLLNWIQSNNIPVLEREGVTPTKLFPRRKKIFDDGPPLFYVIQERIKNQFNLNAPHDWQGQVFVHDPGMGTRQHTDNDSIRMTLMLQRADDGGSLIHAGKPFVLPERSLSIYNPKTPHAVGQVKKGSRVVIIYFWDDSPE